MSDIRKHHVCEYAGCGAKFSRPGRLKIHYRTHTGERPYVCDRPGCQRSYSRRQHLRRHLASSHGTPVSVTETFRCPVEGCGKVLSTLDTFKKHGKSHERRRHVCSHCGRGFIKRQHLRIHEHQHTGVKPYRCSKEGCEREFVLPSKLRAHEAQHDKYRCTREGCGKQLASWTQLLKHRRQQHPRTAEHKCSQCEKTFLSRYALKVHKKVHGETRDIFHCPYEDCPRYFYFKSNLTSHIRASHEGKGFICPVETCKKKLSCKMRLDAHSRLHEAGGRSERRPRRRQRPRRDRGVARGPRSSTFTQLTGLPDAPPPPDTSADDSPVNESERPAGHSDPPTRKWAVPMATNAGEWVKHVQRSSSEAGSASDESAQL